MRDATRRSTWCLRFVFIVLCGWSSTLAVLYAAEGNWPKVGRVEQQPLVAATERLIQALEFVGSPLDAETLAKLDEAFKKADPADCTEAVEKILDPRCLVAVSINAESRVSVIEGPAKKELIQQGWRTFLVKVHNEAGVTAPLVPESPNLLPVYQRGKKRANSRCPTRNWCNCRTSRTVFSTRTCSTSSPSSRACRV